MSLKQLFPFLAAFLFLVSCGGKNDRPISESVSAFMNGNGNVASFGSADLQKILDKAEYKSIPKAGKLIEERLGNVLNTKSSIYYVMEGPFDKGVNPATTYVFFDLMNEDSLVELLGSSGLFIENAEDIKYAVVSDDISVGMRGKLAIMVIRKDEYDARVVLQEAFKKAEGKVSGGKTDKLLAKQNDINMNVNLQNLYGTSNTELAKLDQAKQKEIHEMMFDSYIHSAVNFEQGKVVFRSENLFSEALQKHMFFKKDTQASILSKLSTGKACLGVSANFDIAKIEDFIDEFAPDAKDKFLSKIIGGDQLESTLVLMALGEHPMTRLIGGTAGIVVVGDPRMTGFTPDVNFMIGSGTAGKPYLSIFAEKKLKDFKYIVTDTELMASSPNAGMGMTSLVMPDCAKDFGKEGITAFANFDGMDLQSFGLPMKYKYVGIMKNITFKMDNKGSELVISALDPNKNILKQLVDLYVKDFEGMMGNVAI